MIPPFKEPKYSPYVSNIEKDIITQRYQETKPKTYTDPRYQPKFPKGRPGKFGAKRPPMQKPFPHQQSAPAPVRNLYWMFKFMNRPNHAHLVKK